MLLQIFGSALAKDALYASANQFFLRFSARNDSHGNSTVQLYLVTQLQQYFRRLGQSQIIIFFLKCNILSMEQFTTYSFHKCLTELIQY